MKLKLITLSALFAAGICASVALAHDGKGGKHKDDNGCRGVEVSGTIAPQTFTITVDKARGGIAAGTQLTLTVGGTGQTVRLKAEACSGGTGTTSQLTVKQVELRAETPKVAKDATGGKKGDRHDGERKGDRGKTTTAATTTTAQTTTTAPTTTTTAPTTTG